jgi:hypothetical protein
LLEKYESVLLEILKVYLLRKKSFDGVFIPIVGVVSPRNIRVGE